MSDPLNRILSALGSARPSGAGFLARCPAHEDRRASLSISRGADGRALLKCHAGCSADAIVTALKLRMQDLFPDRNGCVASRATDRTANRVALNRGRGDSATVTVADLARHKRLPERFLLEQGLRNTREGVEIPYCDLEGRESITRIRTALSAKEGSRWPKGTRLQPYGLDRLRGARKSAALLVEGETDALTLWFHRRSALGIPGASATKCLEAPHLEGIATLYVWREPGTGGAAFVRGLAKRLDEIGFGGDVLVLELEGTKDVSELHLSVDGDRSKFEAGIAACVRKARPISRVRDELGPETGSTAGSTLVRAGRRDDAAVGARALVRTDEDETENDVVEPYLLFEEFPVDSLPIVAREFVLRAAEAQGVSPSFFAVPLLVLAAGMIGTSRCVLLKRGYRELPIVWAALVARSGSGKSPALAACLRLIKPLRDRLRREYWLSIDAHRRAISEWKRRNDQPGAELDEPQEPKEQRLLVSDATYESLIPILDENRRGLLLCADELATWLDFDRYAGGGKKVGAARWLPLWAGDAVDYDRKGGGGAAGQRRAHIYIPRAALSVVGAIPPETLRAVLSAERLADGLVARLCFASPPDPMKEWTERTVSDDVEDRMRLLLERLHGLQPERSKEDDLRPVDVALAPDAKAVWIARHNELVETAQDDSDAMRAAASKIRAYAARFALVLALVEDPNAPTISERAMEAGWAIARWFLCEHRRVLSRLAERPDTQSVRCFVELLQQEGGRATLRALVRGSSRYRGEGGTDRCRRDADRAIGAGVARWGVDIPPGPGRPAEVVELITAGDGDTIRESLGKNDNCVTVTTPDTEQASRPARLDHVPIERLEL